MVAPSGIPDLDEEPPKQRPVGLMAGIITFLLLLVIGVWITKEKKYDKVRQDMLAAMDKELTTDEAAMKTQREKLSELSRQVEEMRASIEMGQHRDGKAAVARFNKLAAEQRAERQKFTQMAEEYNKKVAEFRKIEQ